MAQTIKVHRIAIDISEVKEVNLEEASWLVEDAYAQGHLVIDKETGDIVGEITSNIREIYLVGVLGGG